MAAGRRRTSPVTRSRKRTEPSLPPSSSVRSSGLRLARAAPSGQGFSTRSVRASRIAVGPPSTLVTSRRPSRITSGADGLPVDRPGSSARRAGVRCGVEALDGDRARPGRRRGGEQRASVRREAEPVTNRLSSVPSTPGGGRARVQEPASEPPTASRDAVAAEPEALEPVSSTDRPPGTVCGGGDPLPRARVEQAQRAVGVEDGQGPAVRAEVERVQPRAAAAQDADRRRAPEQRGEQVAARLRRVVERDALAGEQQRAVEVVVRERLGPEALRGGGRRLGARGAALVERDQRPRSPPGRAATRRPPARGAGVAGRARPRGGRRRGTRARSR